MWLQSELRDLGIADGDAVLIHTSMKGLRHIDGGADTVIDALLSVVGKTGTLLFPTLTGSGDDGPLHPPRIELDSTPCASWVGIVPEVARQRADAVRSHHPTHSVTALGARQAFWTQGHEFGSSPCDESSPYARLMDEGGKILLLGGVTHESNTSLHCIEELAKVPYHLQDEFTDGLVRLPDGQEIVVRNRLHIWGDLYSHLNLSRWFEGVAAPLTAAGAQRTGRIGQSISTLIDARAMREVLLPLLRNNPLFLLSAR